MSDVSYSSDVPVSDATAMSEVEVLEQCVLELKGCIDDNDLEYKKLSAKYVTAKEELSISECVLVRFFSRVFFFLLLQPESISDCST